MSCGTPGECTYSMLLRSAPCVHSSRVRRGVTDGDSCVRFDDTQNFRRAVSVSGSNVARSSLHPGSTLVVVDGDGLRPELPGAKMSRITFGECTYSMSLRSALACTRIRVRRRVTYGGIDVEVRRQSERECDGRDRSEFSCSAVNSTSGYSVEKRRYGFPQNLCSAITRVAGK